MGGRTAPEWAAEHEVGAELAARLVAERFPELSGAAVEPLGVGWDNTVFLVDDEWVFRFPRRSIAVPLLEKEVAVLPRLAARLPLPIPDPRYVAGPEEGEFPWPFWGARIVPGVELHEAGLAEHRRVKAAEDMGGFLRVLHDPALVQVVQDDLPYDPNGRAVPTKRADKARQSLAALSRKGLWEPDPAVEALLGQARYVPVPKGRVVNHGDLHVRHVLVDDRDRVAGIIDWGDVCLADPAVDLSLAYGAFGGRARKAMLDAYGPVDEAGETAARILAVSLCAALADYAAATAGRGRLLAEALRGIHRAAN